MLDVVTMGKMQRWSRNDITAKATDGRRYASKESEEREGCRGAGRAKKMRKEQRTDIKDMLTLGK